MLGSPTYAPPIWDLKKVDGKYEKTVIPQIWKKSNILGQDVRWYQEFTPNSERGAIFKTEGFQLKHPDGRKGNYRVTGEGTEASFRARLSQLSFK